MEKKEKKQNIKKRENVKTKKEMGNSQILCMLKGIVMAYAVTCIIFITYGIVLTYTDVTEEKLPLIALCCTVISAGIAGFDWARCAKARGILWGILAGLAYGVILFVLDGIAGSGFSVVGSKGLMILLAAAGGGVGGILGINMKKG
ncbi:MAG: TIGR04086 family membrane protein [Firmicutes bacterium]|nr:TIGR04086 family membrane protein [Bacillota bacterium]